jgi:hypothetical protein
MRCDLYLIFKSFFNALIHNIMRITKMLFNIPSNTEGRARRENPGGSKHTHDHLANQTSLVPPSTRLPPSKSTILGKLFPGRNLSPVTCQPTRPLRQHSIETHDKATSLVVIVTAAYSSLSSGPNNVEFESPLDLFDDCCHDDHRHHHIQGRAIL